MIEKFNEEFYLFEKAIKDNIIYMKFMKKLNILKYFQEEQITIVNEKMNIFTIQDEPIAFIFYICEDFVFKHERDFKQKESLVNLLIKFNLKKHIYLCDVDHSELNIEMKMLKIEVFSKGRLLCENFTKDDLEKLNNILKNIPTMKKVKIEF